MTISFNRNTYPVSHPELNNIYPYVTGIWNSDGGHWFWAQQYSKEEEEQRYLDEVDNGKYTEEWCGGYAFLWNMRGDIKLMKFECEHILSLIEATPTNFVDRIWENSQKQRPDMFGKQENITLDIRSDGVLVFNVQEITYKNLRLRYPEKAEKFPECFDRKSTLYIHRDDFIKLYKSNLDFLDKDNTYL